MEHADTLDRIDADHPFALLCCGPFGVIGLLDAVPGDAEAFAARLFEVCPELAADWQIRIDAEGGNTFPPASLEALIPRLAAEIAEDRTFWLPWGVDH